MSNTYIVINEGISISVFETFEQSIAYVRSILNDRKRFSNTKVDSGIIIHECQQFSQGGFLINKSLVYDNTNDTFISQNQSKPIQTQTEDKITTIINKTNDILKKPTGKGVDIIPKIEADNSDDKNEFPDIEKLKHIAKSRKKAIDEQHNDLKDAQEKFSDKMCELTHLKHEYQKAIEKDKAKKNKYIVNKRLYFTISEQLENKTLTKDKIPPLFTKEFEVFSRIKKEHKLDTKEEYDLYCKYMNELTQVEPIDNYGEVFNSNIDIAKRKREIEEENKI